MGATSRFSFRYVSILTIVALKKYLIFKVMSELIDDDAGAVG